jgi:pimeloyl-ACP methyl ester carboxylesterase
MSSRFFLLLSIGLVACGDDDAPPADAGAGDGGSDGAVQVDGGPPMDWPGMEMPASTVPETGVRRDVFRVPGATPPPNPTTMAETPAELDFTQVIRYREDVTPPAEARAIIVAMPGFLGGGPSFETLAHELVKRGAASGTTTEVWAIDRRSNLLEDLRGMDTAEASGNPDIAQGYYFGRETIDGEPFSGFTPAAQLTFMSEWGLRTHAEDLRRVIALVPEADRQGHVFLMGHSLGGAFTEAYASWRFEDGTRGVEELAGLILVDGHLRDAASTEDEYRDGTAGLTGGPGIDGIRMSSPYTALPILGLAIYARAEIMSLRTLVDPMGIVTDGGRDQVLAILLSLSPAQVPPMTNRGALGWGFDTASNAFSFAAVSCGESTGGPTAEYENTLFGSGTLLHPSDPEATYDWVDALDADPPEHTPLAALATSWSHGRANFAEWYFPSRLPLDLAAVGGTDVAEDSWQAMEGLSAFDRELVDAPVLAIAAALVGPTGYDTLASRLAPEVGAGRRNAGAARTDELGLRIVDLSSLSHLDPLTGVDTDRNPTALEVARFVDEHVAATGTVAIDAM